jgi:hypothetical protein
MAISLVRDQATPRTPAQISGESCRTRFCRKGHICAVLELAEYGSMYIVRQQLCPGRQTAAHPDTVIATPHALAPGVQVLILCGG